MAAHRSGDSRRLDPLSGRFTDYIVIDTETTGLSVRKGAKLIEIGCEVIEFDDAGRVVGKPVQRHTDIKTLPYPGFPTDMRPAHQPVRTRPVKNHWFDGNRRWHAARQTGCA